jgi:uncharacterized protein YccT (UPF0319 family)
MNKILISESEKARILGMHYNAMGKKLIKEGNEFRMTPEETKATGLTSVIEPDEYRFDAGGFNIFFDTDKFEMRDKTLYYDCIQDPRDKEDKPAGSMYDEVGNPITAAQAGLKGPYIDIFRKYCKSAYNWLADYNAKNAPKAQVAAKTTEPTTVTAPNPTTDKDVAASKANAAASKANAEKMKAELTTKLADPNFLNPNKYDTDKAGLDADAKAASLYTSIQGIVMGDDIMTLKRKINTLIKAKPEYKGEPFFLNINF